MNPFRSDFLIVVSALRADPMFCAGRAMSPTEPSSVATGGDRSAIVTSDITLKKACRAPLRLSQPAHRGHFPIYILFIFICHIMSLRHQPLLEGLSSVTFLFPLLSFVTPRAGHAPSLSIPQRHALKEQASRLPTPHRFLIFWFVRSDLQHHFHTPVLHHSHTV